jgi:hypothetical protein
VGVGLAGFIAEPVEQGQGMVQVDACLVEAAGPGVGMADSQVSVGLSPPVGVVIRGGQRGFMGSGEVVPVSLPFEECHQHVRELPRMGVVAGVGGQLDDAQQHGIFGCEPGPGGRVIGGLLWRHPPPRRSQGDVLLLVGIGLLPGCLCAMHVVIQNPLLCCLLICDGVVGVRLVGGVGAEKVVEGEPARGVLGDEVGTVEFGQHLAGVGERDGGQAGSRGRGDVGPGMQAEQPEQPRCRVAELPVGP